MRMVSEPNLQCVLQSILGQNVYLEEGRAQAQNQFKGLGEAKQF